MCVRRVRWHISDEEGEGQRMSATRTVFSYGDESPVEEFTPNDPVELMAMLNALLTQLLAFNNVDPATGHTHNGTDAAPIVGDTGEGVNAIQSTGSPFAIGTLVYITGRSGVNYTVAKAQAKDPSNTSLYAQYVVTVALASAVAGVVYKRARVTAQNTAGGTVGRPIWLSSTAGGFTVTVPQPYGCQVVGYVETVDAAAGVVNIEIGRPVPQSAAHEV